MPVTRRGYLKELAGSSVVVASGLAGCGFAKQKRATTKLRDDSQVFHPCNLRNMAKDARLFFRNKGNQPHSVVAASDNWDVDETLEPGNGFLVRLQNSGVYKAVDAKNGSPGDFSGARVKIAVGDAKIQDAVPC